MNNQLQIFNNDQFGKIRMIEIDDKPYFVATDIAKALGYAKPNNAIQAHCKYTLKHSIPHPQSKNKTLEVNVIPEGDMYRLITNSELPQAEKFERWVFDEVLPSIRKTGYYQTPKVLSPREQLELQLQIMKEQDKKIEAVKDEVADLRDNMPLLGVDCDEIVKVVKSVATKVLGGYKETPAYKDKSLNRKVYADIYSQLKREFQVNSYKSIKRCQLEQAKENVRGYKLPTALADEIVQVNNQISF